MNRSAHELTTDLGDEVMNLPGAAVSTWVSPSPVVGGIGHDLRGRFPAP